MGTDAVVGGASAAEAEAIERLFADWEQVFSRFRPQSELNRINADPAPVAIVSRLFASVVRDAIDCQPPRVSLSTLERWAQMQWPLVHPCRRSRSLPDREAQMLS